MMLMPDGTIDYLQHGEIGTISRGGVKFVDLTSEYALDNNGIRHLIVSFNGEIRLRSIFNGLLNDEVDYLVNSHGMRYKPVNGVMYMTKGGRTSLAKVIYNDPNINKNIVNFTVGGAHHSMAVGINEDGDIIRFISINKILYGRVILRRSNAKKAFSVNSTDMTYNMIIQTMDSTHNHIIYLDQDNRLYHLVVSKITDLTAYENIINQELMSENVIDATGYGTKFVYLRVTLKQ